MGFRRTVYPHITYLVLVTVVELQEGNATLSI